MVIVLSLLESIHTSDIQDILESSLLGSRPSQDDCIRMLESDDVYLLGMVANYLTKKQFDMNVSFISNIILNYTNVCITDCKFCAFYRSPGASDAYTRSLDDIMTRIKLSWEMFKIRQVLFQGGHNPDLGIEYYEDVFRNIREKFPQIGVHALSTSEIDMIARVEKSSTFEILSRLKDAGLQSLPGAGAEILTDSVKQIISPKKITSDEWIRIMDEAHSLDIPSSATMMYGHVETNADIAEHMYRIIQLQEKTHGFMAFIPWSFEPNNTPMQQVDPDITSSGGTILLKMIAVSRIMFDGLIPHIQSSWLTNGIGMAQMALRYGANDFGGTLIGEEVVSCTGARSTELSSQKIIHSINQIGYTVQERDNLYNVV